MGTSLPIFLLALCIIRGLSLECEECIGLTDCSGNKSPCGSGKDRCSVTNMALPIGISVTIKSCVSSNVCDKGLQVINVGRGEHVAAHLRCCEGGGCRDVVPAGLPKKAAANGKQCPACFAMGETCQEEVLDCSGDELYCAEGRLDAKSVMPNMEVSLKGCANKAFCDSLVGFEAMAPEKSGRHTIRCISNSSVYQEFSTVGQETESGVVNTNPRWFGLFITILSGLIFFQV
ncbi:phospholipase A2 inhibitor gamma subunit B-like [Vipera latastei]